MSNNERWIQTCAARIQKNTGISAGMALLEAQSLADEQTELHGASGLAWQAPEDAADEHDEGSP